MSLAPVIEASHISKRYGKIVAIEDVSFTVGAREVVALVGDNGAGKSTIVKCLSGVIPLSSGSIAADGRTLTLDGPVTARDAGIETVYQDLALALNMSIADNVFLGREILYPGVRGLLRMVDRKTMESRASTEIEQLKIRVPPARRRANDLSGGQRQAIAVARAVAWGSRLVVMDEPTAALGVEEQHQVGELISGLKQRGISVLLVSHNIPQVHERSDRILVMFQGRLVADLVTSEVSIEDIVMWITGSALGSV